MKKNYFKYVIITFIIYIKLFNYVVNKDNNTNLRSNEETNKNTPQNNNKKNLILLIIKTLGSCIAIIIIYIIANKIIKYICQKREVYTYLNKILKKKGRLDQKSIAYLIVNLNIKYFIKFIENELMNTCKYKNREKYTKYETGCSICLGEFKPQTKVIITSCEHIFHYTCMIKFLKLIEKEMFEKRNEDNIPNFLNLFNCPNCKFNILQKRQKEKDEIKEIKIINVEHNMNKNPHNLIRDINSTISNSNKIRDTKSSSELSLSSGINLNNKSMKTKKIYSRKAKLFRKKKSKKKLENKTNININNNNININIDINNKQTVNSKDSTNNVQKAISKDNQSSKEPQDI